MRATEPGVRTHRTWRSGRCCRNWNCRPATAWPNEFCGCGSGPGRQARSRAPRLWCWRSATRRTANSPHSSERRLCRFPVPHGSSTKSKRRSSRTAGLRPSASPVEPTATSGPMTSKPGSARATRGRSSRSKTPVSRTPFPWNNRRTGTTGAPRSSPPTARSPAATACSCHATRPAPTPSHTHPPANTSTSRLPGTFAAAYRCVSGLRMGTPCPGRTAWRSGSSGPLWIA